LKDISDNLVLGDYMPNNSPRTSSLTFIGFEINSLPERTKCDQITFEYVYKGIEEKNLLHKLSNDFGDNVDLSLYLDDPSELDAIYASLGQAAAALNGRERRKTGVESSGQRLIIALLLEAIQQRSRLESLS
jgi:hypothetical protein